MRLLECNSAGEFSLTEDIVNDDEIPPYAILSYTWKEGEEVAYPRTDRWHWQGQAWL